LRGLSFGSRRYVIALGSSLGSTASCRIFFPLRLSGRIVASKSLTSSQLAAGQ